MQKNKISKSNTHQKINIKIALKVSSIGILLYPLSFFISSIFLFHANTIPPERALAIISHSIVFLISFILCYVSSKASSGSLLAISVTSLFSLLYIYICLFVFTKGVVSSRSLYIILNVLISAIFSFIISNVFKKRKKH